MKIKVFTKIADINIINKWIILYRANPKVELEFYVAILQHEGFTIPVCYFGVSIKNIYNSGELEEGPTTEYSSVV